MTALLPSSSLEPQLIGTGGVVPKPVEPADRSHAPMPSVSWAAPELIIHPPGGRSELRVVLPSDEQSVVVVGRDAKCQIALDDPHVSRRHLKIVWTGGRHCVSDLDSRWGVTLNGEPLRRPIALRHGDVLVAGTTFLRYVYYSSALRDMFVPPVVTKEVDLPVAPVQRTAEPAAQPVRPDEMEQAAARPAQVVASADPSAPPESRWYDKFVLITALVAVVLIALALIPR